MVAYIREIKFWLLERFLILSDSYIVRYKVAIEKYKDKLRKIKLLIFKCAAFFFFLLWAKIYEKYKQYNFNCEL